MVFIHPVFPPFTTTLIAADDGVVGLPWRCTWNFQQPSPIRIQVGALVAQVSPDVHGMATVIQVNTVDGSLLLEVSDVYLPTSCCGFRHRGPILDVIQPKGKGQLTDVLGLLVTEANVADLLHHGGPSHPFSLSWRAHDVLRSHLAAYVTRGRREMAGAA